MKKILVTMTSMHIGGAERSLIGLLSAIDYTKYEVDLLLYRHEGEFLPFLPKKVRLLPYLPQYDTLDRPIVQLLRSKRFLFGLARLFAKVKTRLYCKTHHIEKPSGSLCRTIRAAFCRCSPKSRGSMILLSDFLGYTISL